MKENESRKPYEMKGGEIGPYEEALSIFVEDAGREFTMTDVRGALGISRVRFTRDIQTRFATALKNLGCERVERRGGMERYFYIPPHLIDD